MQASAQNIRTQAQKHRHFKCGLVTMVTKNKMYLVLTLLFDIELTSLLIYTVYVWSSRSYVEVMLVS